MNPPRVAVAYSAGRDSTALLHATAHAAATEGVQVVALHVHHGLSPHADAWLAHAQAQCREWAHQGLPITLLHRRLATRPAPGDSVEAWARQARYQALGEMAHEAGATLVLLAHHRRDQAETWLLQALRGAGVDGLAGMPEAVVRDGLTWARPWLRHPREAIEAYVAAHGLAYVNDDSNTEARLARNRLRLSVWPALTAAFPQTESALADAATWAAQAGDALRELAAMDLARVSDGPHLRVVEWMQLSTARRSNVLRTWLKLQFGVAAPAALVVRLMDELPVAANGQWQTPGGALRQHQGSLRWTANRALGAETAAPESTLAIRRAGRFPLRGWGGELVARRVREGGVPLAWLAHLELRARSGGEQFQAGLGRPPRSLKKQYQAAGVPEWQREGPLVYSGGQLVFVPGLGLDARVVGLPDQPQLGLTWCATTAAD